MHKIAIPQSVIDDVVRSRGREHVFEDFDPARAALLVVDMQNAFMMEDVGHSVCAMAREVVPNINRIAEVVRRNGGTVVWIQNAATEETLQSWSIRVEMDGPERTLRQGWTKTLAAKAKPGLGSKITPLFLGGIS